MAKQRTAVSSSLVFIVFLLIAGSLSSSAARILVDCHRSILELPRRSISGAGDVTLHCDGNPAKDAGNNGGFRSLRRCGGQLLLSMLPKGAIVPPSAPSRRTNDLNN